MPPHTSPLQLTRESQQRFILKSEKTQMTLLQPILRATIHPLFQVKNATHNPYMGLSPFHTQDHPYFFGREALTRQLWEKCHRFFPQAGGYHTLRFLPLLGPAGIGKTSLVQAGLLPALIQRPLPLLPRLRTLILTPTAYPLINLGHALAQLAGCPSHTQLIIETLYQPEGLTRCLKTLFREDKTPLLLIIDQLEELCTFAERQEEVQVFIDNILSAAANPETHITIITTLRTENLRDIQQYPFLYQAITQNGIIIPTLSVDEIHRAISIPATLQQHPLQPTLIAELLRQTHTATDKLPLLQFTLALLWGGKMSSFVDPEQLLEKIGGLSGAINYTAERLFTRLGKNDQTLVKNLFKRLFQYNSLGQTIARRTVPINTLFPADVPANVAQELLHTFAHPEARLITMNLTPLSAEATHEIISTRWQRLQEWLIENHEEKRFMHRLTQAAKDWKKHKKSSHLLWQSTDLDLLRRFHADAWRRMSHLQHLFFTTSEQHAHRLNRWRKAGIAALIALNITFIASWTYQQLHTKHSSPPFTGVLGGEIHLVATSDKTASPK